MTLLQVNDLHGYVAAHPEMVRDDHGEWRFAEMGGLARIAHLFAAVRAENPDGVIALDNGDTFHGTHVAVSSQGRALVPMMNMLHLDAMTVHWEFAYGPEGVERIASGLDHPMLAINCYRKRDGELFFAPYRIVKRAGFRIAIIGMACPIVDKTMPAAFSEGLSFTTGNKELPGFVDRVRAVEKADLVIVLSHLGFPQDVKLAQEVSGIDVIASGHTHNRMEEAIVVNGAVILQSGCHGSFVGRLDMQIEHGKVARYVHRLIPIDVTIPEDPRMAGLVSAARSDHRAMMAEVVGSVTAPLHRYAMLKSPMDDVLLEAIATAAGTELAFSNGWRYGAPIPPGRVTLEDLWNIIPTNPPVSVVDVTGEEILTMIEDNLERTFAADPFQQMGGYVKRMRGLKLFFKAENPKGHRVDRLYVEGRPVASEQVYSVAFVTDQAVPDKFGRNRRQAGTSAIDALRSHFRTGSPITPSAIEPVVEV